MRWGCSSLAVTSVEVTRVYRSSTLGQDCTSKAISDTATAHPKTSTLSLFGGTFLVSR